MMVGFKKILSQTSRIGKRKAGHYRYILYRVQKTETTPANHITGVSAVYTETLTEIAGFMSPFMAKRWGAVAEDYADFMLSTNVELAWDSDDEDLNEEIEYDSVRYRIVNGRHHELLLLDDYFSYALRRKSGQSGGLSG